MTLVRKGLGVAKLISIHMPHTWHDVTRPVIIAGLVISIHMPHTWHDITSVAVTAGPKKFQSTCHIRGMTFPPPLLMCDKEVIEV